MSATENDYDELLSQYVDLLNAHGESLKEVKLFEKKYVGDKKLSKLFKRVRELKKLSVRELKKFLRPRANQINNPLYPNLLGFFFFLKLC